MKCTNKPQTDNGEQGFSLLEMLVVIAIIFILAAMAIISINGALPSQQSAAGLNAAVAVFRQGRESSIAQRRFYELVVPAVNPPNQIGLQRLGIGATALPVTTLPAPAQFGLDPSITVPPEPGLLQPTCASGLCFGGSAALPIWQSDGTFVQGGNSQPLNAVIYVMIPGNPGAQRAFTILGSTGRIRTYKWTGGSWVLQ